MDIDEIRNLYAYNTWANGRLLADARSLEPEDFVRGLGTSYGSVRGTLVHILWGEWLWLQRWRGVSPKRVFDPEDYPHADAIESPWKIVQREQQEFIGTLTGEKLKARLSYENLQGRRWEYSLAHMMQHVVNHSSYHRGQVAALLRQLGRTPPATDFLLFFDEAAERVASDR